MNENNLCNYYDLDKTPGLKAKGKFVTERFAYLDDEPTVQKLIQFSSPQQVNVTCSVPQMHCSSCIYLLENLHRIEPGVKQSQVNFQQKEVFIIFNPQETTLRKIVELLSFIGYEPYISLKDTVTKKVSSFNRRQIYKIGVAGFCFSNIMMLSFPEYFSGGNIDEAGLKETFSWIIFVESILFMAFFGLGTLPIMWSIAFFGNYAGMGFRQKIRRAYPYMMALMACLLIIRGMGLGIPYVSPKMGMEKHQVHGCCSKD